MTGNNKRWLVPVQVCLGGYWWVFVRNIPPMDDLVLGAKHPAQWPNQNSSSLERLSHFPSNDVGAGRSFAAASDMASFVHCPLQRWM